MSRTDRVFLLLKKKKNEKRDINYFSLEGEREKLVRV